MHMEPGPEVVGFSIFLDTHYFLPTYLYIQSRFGLSYDHLGNHQELLDASYPSIEVLVTKFKFSYLRGPRSRYTKLWYIRSNYDIL